MIYRILEHPEGNFIAQRSKDSGMSWVSILTGARDREVSESAGTVVIWGRPKKKTALKIIEEAKEIDRKNAITRVVHCE